MTLNILTILFTTVFLNTTNINSCVIILRIIHTIGGVFLIMRPNYDVIPVFSVLPAHWHVSLCTVEGVVFATSGALDHLGGGGGLGMVGVAFVGC